mmetsp:Transcript_11120/g.21288  ORF Transcript_11120/g.21288 Transcript_11120/m.21288 type:complete len:300 (+) Transcript_11120:158-1057(+)
MTSDQRVSLTKEGPYRAPKSSTASTFLTMRAIHRKVKGLLYRAYGGKSIVDACCGRIADFDSWSEAGIERVLALEKDSQLVEIARERLKTFEKEGRKLQCNLQQVDLSAVDFSCDEKKDAIFCNFALHYFWETDESARRFLDRFVPHLAPGGYFVVTYMDGEVIAEEGEINIVNAMGITEFKSNVVGKRKVDVYIESIGRTHQEALVTPSNLREQFKSAGLEHVATHNFEDLRSLFPNLEQNMTSPELEMSNLFRASVFVKPMEKGLGSYPFQALSEHVRLEDVLSLCGTKELTKVRGY